MQAMRAKLQKAKRTLDNMKKREADAIAAKEAAEARAAALQAQADKAGYLPAYYIVGDDGNTVSFALHVPWPAGNADKSDRSCLTVATLLATASR